MLDMAILVSVVTLDPCADYAWWVFLFLPAFLLPYHVYRSADTLVIAFSIQSCVVFSGHFCFLRGVMEREGEIQL